MAKKNRDEFLKSTILQIAKRSGWLCSFPQCRAPTVGATADGQGEIVIGTAAHICAAAPGGPRYDSKMSEGERSSADNGIWMCRDHGKAIDDEKQFTTPILREWKKQAELESWQHVLRTEAAIVAIPSTNADLTARLRTAAEHDLEVFRKTTKWPSTSVALTLEVDGFDSPVSTDALARAVTSLDDLILVAGPGMGKTTTVFQIAEGVLENARGVPLVVLLNDWATEGATVLESILKRPAFKGITEDDFRKVATQSGVVLLLDGWNELDAEARKKARVQVNALKAELPALGLVVSTRKLRNQALDVPFGGKRIDILPLNIEQQMQIADAIQGKDGVKLVDQALRTPGVRELMTIPLYLTTLLSLSKGTTFPTTKEEVLRHFVTAHEKEASRAEALHAIVQDFHQNYLKGLAVFATRMVSTAIADSDARTAISDTATFLVGNKQITTKPEPNAVLDVLVSSHLLMRAGSAPGVSFQHQQFQEWYASHYVERRILAEVNDPKAREALKVEIFNFPVWEEAILFAVERMSRADAQSQAACSKAILDAFEVDPILAAEMIFRSTNEVWMQIAKTIQEHVAAWHASGKVDRPCRFMLTSGRPEFLDTVWPLITHEEEQVSLRALRNCKRFRPSILGKDAVRRIKALAQKPRELLLHEIAMHSGIDGMDLATEIAKDDPDPEVKEAVASALSFRRADRHVAEVLRTADKKTFDLIARKGNVDEIDDKDVQQGIQAAYKRLVAEDTSIEDRLRSIAYAEIPEDQSAELTKIISTMEINKGQDTGAQHIYKARSRYPRAVAEGLLARVRACRNLFYGADDILASSGLVLEDEELLKLTLTNTANDDNLADAAASVLGPNAVGKIIDVLLELIPRIRTDNAASEAYRGLERRIAHAPGASLVAAVVERSPALNSEQMAHLAELFSRRGEEDSDRSRPFDADSLAAIQGLAQDWGARMLVADDARRWHKAHIPALASRAPHIGLLPLLKELLDDNLRRFREFRVQAEAAGWQGPATGEARHPHTDEYKRAFMAIKTPETAALMREYLEDEHFGPIAALVLADQWRSANKTPKDRRFLGGVDFSDVKDKRIARATDPDATCEEAEMVFAAIDRLIAEGTTKKQQMLAVSLAIRTLDLPHGRRDATIRKLLYLAPRKAYETARSDLLLRLVLSGEEIDLADVNAGINETLEAAKNDWCILNQSDGYQLKVWLRLLPFVSKPIEALPVILALPDAQREPRFLQDMMRLYAYAPAEKVEEILFMLAEADPRFYMEHKWRDSVMALGTASSGHRLVDLVVGGALGKDSAIDGRHLVHQLAALLSEHTDLRGHVYELLKDGVTSPGLEMLAGAVAENPDEDGILMLVRCEQHGRSLRAWRTIEKVVTEHVPVEGYQNSYNVTPVPVADLRRKLFAMTTDGGPKDVAAVWLNQIDGIRDRHGLPEDEPRHPDLASGKPWPIMRPGSEAEDDG